MFMTFRRGALWPRVAAALVSMPLCLVPAAPGFGQSTDNGSSEDPGQRPTGAGGTTAPSDFSDYLTNAIVLNLRAVREECSRYDPIYRLDCVQQGFEEVARRMPQGDYREARQIIFRAAAQLDSVVARNADRSVPRQRSVPNRRFKQKKTYTAVKRQNLRQAMQQAERVVAEAETRLLRSAENSEKRYSHYQQIAAAVGSNKVLLRSA
ncbi:hypothetical protein LXM94_14010 [Rhizobium sp. TRM95111]|uniref:hypothetical protein n=1 Tax=Rhizobium alarense TaxID=2846851 RepID=UPI001F2473D2|nr:hypothetical protein [Rhizobium alarense]MCF3641086.1 hypothetical protein [Rhizobium alarense]